MHTNPDHNSAAAVRLDALEATGLLDTPAEAAFDRFTLLASKVLGTPVSLISLIDHNRQFFKSQIGLAEPWASARETPLSHSFCQYVVRDQRPLVVADSRQDPLVCNNLAIGDLGVRAYLGVPLTTSQGQTLGSLCVIDHSPRDWDHTTLAILTDLAAMVMTEIELRLIAGQLKAAYRRLQQLELQRSELVIMLVHDLRNPLTSVIGGLDLLMDAKLDSVAQGDVAMARQGAEQLLGMVSDILEVNRAEHDEMGLRLEESAPDEIVAMACEQVDHLARSSGVSLVRSSGRAPAIRVDRAKLRRALVNLLANAIQHSSQGGGVTIAAAPTVDGRGVEFQVADSGSGIPEEALPTLFEKFRNTRHNRSGRMSTGLGLPFCKIVAEAHGGRIDVRTRLGEGTTFAITIPL